MRRPARGHFSRRELLKLAASAAGLAALPGGLRAADGGPAATPRPPEWSNWSGSQLSHPRAWLAPNDEAELVRQLKNAEGTIRVTGASHSFSALCKTDDTLVSLDKLSGVVAHDPGKLQATVWAGSRLRDLGAPLWDIGQAFINQGDVNPQSVAGACGTSTHGTGISLGSFSSVVRGARIVTPQGDVVECSPQRNSDVFHAACTSLGALGVVTQMTLQNRKTYLLHEQEYAEPLDTVLGKLAEYVAENRHFEFWVFFGSDTALVKRLNETDREPTPPPAIDLPVDAVLTAASEIAHRLPALDGTMQKLLTGLHVDSDRVGRSYEIFPSPRRTRFNEMEYEIPAAKGPECLQEILATVRAQDLNTLFPVEYRHVAADDCWLSPFYGRASASISIHQYHTVDYRPLFAAVEPVFRKYEGRPHWGKLHTLTARELAPLYPRWDDWQRVRRRLDPRGRMLNAHLRELFGVPQGRVI
jgi:FAD-linked oxidoreductase